MKKAAILALLLAAAGSAQAQAPASAARRPALKLERVVLLMRHGVRPPTKNPPMPAGVAAEAWPGWTVAPGYLTERGAKAIALVAAADRQSWVAAGLIPAKGCAKVRIIADSDQRTIETGRIYGEGVAAGCPVALEHKPQDVADPIFSIIDEKMVEFDPAKARAAVIADLGPGGLAALDVREKPVLDRLNAILCGAAKTACGVGGGPTGLAPAVPDKRPKLTGAIDRASTVAQILLLEYADGKPMSDVGWGRATPADIERGSALHALEFQVLARPRYLAARNLALIGAAMRDTMTATDAPEVTMISGHDTNVANLGGLLDLHWKVPGLAKDDPSPGGALIFERLAGADGRRYVRASYRSQSIAQIRALTPLGGAAQPYRAVLPLPGCSALGVAGLCTLAQFQALMNDRLVAAKN